MREYYSASFFTSLARKNRMKQLLMLATVALPWLPTFAQSAADDCALARDPVRCEARQAALKACSEMRGSEKHACLDASMPPVDCSQAQNPQKCESAQKAKEICKGKTGKQLKQCMHDEQPRKKPKAQKSPPAA